MTRQVPGPQISGEVLSKTTNSPLAGVTVTPSQTVYSDVAFTTPVTTLVTDGEGAFRAYAQPGTYTFTVSDPNGVIPEPVQVLSPDEGYSIPLLKAQADAAYGPGSPQWLEAIGGSFGFAFNVVSTYDATTGLPTAATVLWPDGTGGSLTGTIDGGGNGYSGWVVTWTGATTHTVTVTGITYDTNGNALGPTSVAVA